MIQLREDFTHLYQYKHQMKATGKKDHQCEQVALGASTIFLKHHREILTKQTKW